MFMRIQIFFFSLFLLLTHSLIAQQLVNSDYGAYIAKYKSIAIREMKIYKIPASITLAQGMIESGCGKSKLAINTMNHFGIKCQTGWPGDTYLHDDDEKNECFRKYNSVDESYRDHSLFLTTRSRYAALFTLPLNDYKGWAYGLKKAGYATNPDYANMLIRLIESNKLHLLDDSLANPEVTALDEPKTDKKKTAHKVVVPDNGPYINEGRILLRNNYKMPSPSAFEILYTSESGRKVYENCGVPFIFAKKEDTWISIAKEFSIFSFQVFRQNDMQESDAIIPGQIIYLESKKKKNSEKSYKVKTGDSMYSISQEKCVKLAQLHKYNKLKAGEEPTPGFQLKLAR
jgi:GR25 family glycosyltransferase involved in LPS biosynthesis